LIHVVREAAIQRLIGNDECCSSCHSEDKFGAGMCEMDADELGKNRFARVCCKTYEHFLEWQKSKEGVK